MIQKILNQSLQQKEWSRAEILVSQQGKIIAHTQAGLPLSQKYFDLASLTKPLATALITLRFESKKLLRLSNQVNKYFPSATLKGTTLESLLRHTSGLKDWIDFSKRCTDPAAIIPMILNDKNLFNKNRHQTVYSDLGYILLGKILEKIADQNLDDVFEQEISRPLKISHEIFFQRNIVPKKTAQQKKNANGSIPKKAFVPSEISPARGLVQAQVMDDNAYFMGGVAGHAGLFGTAHAINRILMELRQGLWGKSKIFPKALCTKYLLPPPTRNPAKRFFTPGFDTPTQPGSQSGRYFSRQSIGHLGYSGTSFWWDLERDFWIILLANRCYPKQNNKKFAATRPKIHDALVKNLLLI